jgi:hypothetical protein
LCASESISEFESLATDYNTVRVKSEFGAVSYSPLKRLELLQARFEQNGLGCVSESIT